MLDQHYFHFLLWLVHVYGRERVTAGNFLSNQPLTSSRHTNLLVTADRQGTHRSAGQSDSPVTDRHSRASLRSGLTFLVSSGLPRFPDFFVTFRILSLGAASLIQSLPGGYIPRVEKERGMLEVP